MEAETICHNCTNVIDGHECVQVQGFHFHVNCFHCKNCDKDIAGREYIQEDEKFYCSSCYTELFAPQCQGCGKPIQGKFSRVEEHPYHNECLVCNKCGNPIGSEYFKADGGTFYCKDCQVNDAFKCESCAKPILSDQISTMGKHWHDECFTCHICQKSIGDEQVTEKEGNPCHLSCTQSQCDYCGVRIESEVFYQHDNQNYHIECQEQMAIEAEKQVNDDSEKANAAEAERLQQQRRKQEEEEDLKKQMKNLKVEEQQKESPSKQTEPVQPSASPTQQKQVVIDNSRKRYALADLKGNSKIEGIDFTKQEQYLSDQEFQKVFGMKLEEFYQLKKWKQDELKQKEGIF